MDPVDLEILWSRLIGVTNEQSAALMRTSFTSVVRESGDLSAAVFDSQGRMLAQAVTGTPGHINSLATSMKHFLAEYPPNTLRSAWSCLKSAKPGCYNPRGQPRTHAISQARMGL